MNNILNKIESTECSCNQCKLMCYVSPCFPTPEDVDKLLKAGYETLLKPTTYININNFESFNLIAPNSKQIITIDKNGNNIVLNKCVMLDDNNLCKLHKLGLKPTEGKLAIHNKPQDETVEFRVAICETWKDSELANKIFNYFD